LCGRRAGRGVAGAGEEEGAAADGGGVGRGPGEHGAVGVPAHEVGEERLPGVRRAAEQEEVLVVPWGGGGYGGGRRES